MKPIQPIIDQRMANSDDFIAPPLNADRIISSTSAVPAAKLVLDKREIKGLESFDVGAVVTYLGKRWRITGVAGDYVEIQGG